ncbi:hypothetical protein R2F25_09210 [Streptomyces sp. UP1A-1]|nr:hypothetical protein [Streptomyces sp. UP1A-1]
MKRTILVLWDIDRTLVYTGDIDRRVYKETFTSVVGRSPIALLGPGDRSHHAPGRP